MAASFKSIAFACLFLLSIQQVALAITCYSCLGCNSVSSSTGTTSGIYCYKAVGTQSGIAVVNRDSSSVYLSGPFTVGSLTGTYYSCSTDYCNSGRTLSTSFGSILSLIALVIAKWMTMNN